jgi:hypothetical protein
LARALQSAPVAGNAPLGVTTPPINGADSAAYGGSDAPHAAHAVKIRRDQGGRIVRKERGGATSTVYAAPPHFNAAPRG